MDGEESPDPDKLKVVRQRCYPESSKGPFEVFVRQKEKPINVLLVSSELHKNFKTVKEIRKINFGKVRVVFASREEANNAISNELLSRLYRIYVPCDRVEIDGVINQSDIDLNYIVENGSGKFRDPRLPSVPILECGHLVSVDTTEGLPKIKKSHSIRVTFAGTTLPDYVMIDHVLIPVRLFSPKPMHCTKCKRYGHTESLCANKPRCGRCGQLHTEEQCEISEIVCLHCKQKHVDQKDCSFYKERIRFAKARLQQKSKLSYAEMVRQVVLPDISTDNPFSALSDLSDIDEDTAHCSKYTTPKRKKLPSTSHVKKTKMTSSMRSEEIEPPQGLKTSNIQLKTQIRDEISSSPGFSHRQAENETHSRGKLSITELIKFLIETFNLGPVWTEILSKLSPILNNLFSQLLDAWPLLRLFLTIDG